MIIRLIDNRIFVTFETGMAEQLRPGDWELINEINIPKLTEIAKKQWTIDFIAMWQEKQSYEEKLLENI